MPKTIGRPARTLTNRSAGACVVGAAAMLMLAGAAAAARAQDDPNPGALTVTAGVDVLPGTPYIFRGYVQESDPTITVWPSFDLGVALWEGAGGLKTMAVNVGIWSSVHTGSSGSDGPTRGAHYEQDFYMTLNLGFGGGIGLGTTYMALTSPNGMFNTTKELQFKVTKTHRLNPYGFVALELTEVSADGGEHKGAYLELGASPALPIGTDRMSVNTPVKIGLSANNYYEIDGDDTTFGFLAVGGLVTMPLTGMPKSFGAWNLHGGVDLVVMGDRTKQSNEGQSTKVTGLIGIGLSY